MRHLIDFHNTEDKIVKFCYTYTVLFNSGKFYNFDNTGFEARAKIYLILSILSKPSYFM